MLAAILLACAGMILAQSTEPESGQTSQGEELVADTSSLDAGDEIPGAGLQGYSRLPERAQGLRCTGTSDLDLPSVLSADSRVELVAQDRAVKATDQKLPAGLDRIEANNEQHERRER